MLQKRDYELPSKTYKLQDCGQEPTWYVTFTYEWDPKHFMSRPREVFFNSTNMKNLALTNAVKALIDTYFFQNTKYEVLLHELKNVFGIDESYHKKGKFYPTILAEIAEHLEQFLLEIKKK